MITFTLLAVLLTAASLIFILPPLLRRDPAARSQVARDELNLAVLRDQRRELERDVEAGLLDRQAYESARAELERRVLEDVRPSAAVAVAAGNRPVAYGVALAVPVIAATVYLLIGTPAGLDPAQSAPQQQDASHDITPEQMEGMVAGLARKLQSDPGNVDGWHMLARSYNALGRFGEAAKAYEKLIALVPANAELLADYADTLAMAQGKSLQGEPEKLVERALSIDAKNIKALALWGSAAYERRDFADAAARWEKILALVPPESDLARTTQTNVAEARQLAGLAPAPAAANPAAAQPAAAAAARIEGMVDIDPALRAQAAPTDAVFIYARAAEGPRFPLAVQRLQVKDLPATFALDDSMSMMPDAKLSSFPKVVVGARVSKTGSATPAAGDLEGTSAPMAPTAKGVTLKIDTRR